MRTWETVLMSANSESKLNNEKPFSFEYKSVDANMFHIKNIHNKLIC